MKPLTVRCGGCCMIQVLNPESAQGWDQISRYPPIFQKFFAFRGTAWGSLKKLGHARTRGGKI
nr:MAG TPA: PDGF/VEGF domain protein [Caudoviricetes sp.]